MRVLAGGRRREEEEESAFVSMTDMTVSFLFILMILLAFFASRFTDEEVVPRAELLLAEEARDAAVNRADLLDAALETARRRILDLEDEVSRLRSAVIAAEAEAARADALRLAAIRARDEAIDQASKLAAQLRERDDELAELTARLDAGLTSLSALRDELAAALRELEDARVLTAQLDAAAMRIAELEAMLDPEANRPDPLEDYLSGVAISRREALVRVRDAIRKRFPNLDPVISSEADALRFEGEGLFDSGSSRLDGPRRAIVEGIADALDEVLPCYTTGPRAAFDLDCNPGFGIIEAVQIEGHTDRRGNDLSNMRLSTDRSYATFAAMIAHLPRLSDHRNYEEEPVLSVSGYGEGRPVDSGDSAVAMATNRRIDLRFIMLSPSRSEEISIIRERLIGATSE